MSKIAGFLRKADREMDKALDETQFAITVKAVPVDGAAALTKEMATDLAVRALKECFPDRWEEIWNALGKQSQSDRALGAITQAAAANPNAAIGMFLGGVLGAMVAPASSGYAAGRRRRRRQGSR